MKERLLMLGAACGALILFLTVFLGSQRGFGVNREVPRPTTQERGGSGYRAAARWLTSQGIRTVSVQEALDRALAGNPRRSKTGPDGVADGQGGDPEPTEGGTAGLAPRGNVMIVTLPVSRGYRAEEFRALDRWVRAGNTLLVAAALSDEPAWAYGLAGAASDLTLLSGLRFQPLRAAPSAGTGAADVPFIVPQQARLVPNRPHAYFSGVREAMALSDFPRGNWQVSIPSEGFVLALAHDGKTGSGVLWTRTLGEGRVIVSAFGSLFTDRALGLAGNARLLANIIGANLAPRGAVLFDDVHQGLSSAYDPAKFYRDPRLYWTVAIVAAVWLAWVAGSTTPAVPPARSNGPREAELVLATGGFFSRVLRPDAGARRMFELFFQHVHSRTPDGSPWRHLELHPRIGAAEVTQLRRWYEDAHAARRVPLVPLHNLIVQIERRLGA